MIPILAICVGIVSFIGGIRIENPSTNPVSIKIKWADKWTLYPANPGTAACGQPVSAVAQTPTQGDAAGSPGEKSRQCCRRCQRCLIGILPKVRDWQRFFMYVSCRAA